MESGAGAGRRSLWVAGALGLVAAAALLMALAAGGLILRYFREVDYPAGLLISDGMRHRLTSPLILQRLSTYQTVDPLADVYQWYSTTFALGPEAYALGGCLQMMRAVEYLGVLESQMSVMVCDTPSGRVVYVQRSLELHWR